jgi:glycosyltransferase involved in cell wall biosynthesis
MRIIYAVPTDLRATGGHVQHVLGLCRHATKLNIELELLCIDSPNNPEFKDFKPTYLNVGEGGPLKRIRNFCHLALQEIAKRPRPDWIYFRPFPMDYFFFTRHLISKKYRYAYELNTLWAEELRSQGKPLKAILYPWLEAKSIKKASALLPVTEEIAQNAYKMSSVRVPYLVAGNGIEIPSLPSMSKDELRVKWKLPKDNYLIVMAGFTRPWHGYEKLLEALPQLPSDCMVVLIGSENQQFTDEVKGLAQKLGVLNRIHVMGWLSHHDVNEVVYACDLGVSPLALEKKRMKEAQSLKVRHYLAMGLPVLIAGGESRDILNSGYSVQIQETTSRSIQQAIIEMKGLVIKSEDVREYASKNLSWENIASRTFEFLAKL